MKKHPFIKAIADYLFDKISHLVISLAVGVAVVFYQHHATHNQIWGETGDHFGDLVRQVQMLEMQANGHTETNNIGK